MEAKTKKQNINEELNIILREAKGHCTTLRLGIRQSPSGSTNIIEGRANGYYIFPGVMS